MVQNENRRYQKLALTNALPMQILHNIYLIMASCGISNAIYIVDPEAIKGAQGRLPLSRLHLFKEASAPVK
jgi:hypothetical protein